MCKILSLETSKHIRMHIHKYSDYTKLNLHSLKPAAHKNDATKCNFWDWSNKWHCAYGRINIKSGKNAPCCFAFHEVITDDWTKVENTAEPSETCLRGCLGRAIIHSPHVRPQHKHTQIVDKYPQESVVENSGNIPIQIGLHCWMQ